MFSYFLAFLVYFAFSSLLVWSSLIIGSWRCSRASSAFFSEFSSQRDVPVSPFEAQKQRSPRACSSRLRPHTVWAWKSGFEPTKRALSYCLFNLGSSGAHEINLGRTRKAFLLLLRGHARERSGRASLFSLFRTHFVAAAHMSERPRLLRFLLDV